MEHRAEPGSAPRAEPKLLSHPPWSAPPRGLGAGSADPADADALRAALGASGTGTFRWEIQSNALSFDENLDRLFGLTRADTVHTLNDFLLRVHPEDRARVIEACLLSAEEGVDFAEEFRVSWPDGSERWLSEKGRTIPATDGTPLFMTGTCMDVTRLKHVEQELRVAAARAERAARMRDDVLAIVAHDLRTPVHTIIMTAKVLTELPVAEDQRRRHLTIIQRAARTMNHLIGDLLEVTRLESRSLALASWPIAVDGLFGEAIEQFEARARARKVILVSEVAPELPSIAGDRERLLRVLTNLIDNALKFTTGGDRIALLAERDGERVRLSVRDSGVGIPVTSLPHIFDRFWQADQASRAGAGLGLAICKEIVEAHGGRIWAESAPGAGTTFHFTVPAARG